MVILELKMEVDRKAVNFLQRYKKGGFMKITLNFRCQLCDRWQMVDLKKAIVVENDGEYKTKVVCPSCGYIYLKELDCQVKEIQNEG